MPLPLILGLLGAGLGFWGAERANKANKQMAKQQMDFQERLSSSAAQRSVEDYRRAGLNPALAYDRTASSPGGASAQMGNTLADVASNAQTFAMIQQQLKQGKENIKLTQEQQAATRAANMRDTASSALSHRQAIEQTRTTEFLHTLEPHQRRQLAAQTLLNELSIPGARNTAAFEEMMGKMRPGIASARSAAEILKLFRRY